MVHFPWRYRCCSGLPISHTHQTEEIKKGGVPAEDGDLSSELGGEVEFVNLPLPGRSMRWDAPLNCHVFARSMLEALSLDWPESPGPQ